MITKALKYDFQRLEIFNYGIFKGEHSVVFAGPSIQSVTLGA